MSYQQLKQENKKLRDLKISCQEELEKLMEVGRAHENQIDTLLKFNERLLGIIENQFNAAAKSRLSNELQPITQTNEASPQLAAAEKLKDKLALSPPKIGGRMGLDEQDLQAFLEDDQEQIYNQQTKPMPLLQKNQYTPPAVQPQTKATTQKAESLSLNMSKKSQMTKKEQPKPLKLDRVYEMQHNKEEVSINLSNSVKHSQPNSSSTKQKVESSPAQAHLELQVQKLKDMIKEYKQEFVDNSSEYEQICQIIHNDLISDLQQFKKITSETRQANQAHFNSIEKLKKQIKNFRPTNELARVMKKLNVPPATEKLLYNRIINKVH